ncbi:DUF881 domain-containing protein [Mycolicibacterium sp. J2]|uniref:DUF881 domain-containing protein n=1 Tax=Mycolicibacterium sp. J2 TaxID=2993511 RepID=UPI00224B8493|nr:DUF881 domain-containing protein [Mycolicibacterium sp. J2]MCX2713362.1 DUF881 domain-containing protein [Mycolicibacterium sp. J2]
MVDPSRSLGGYEPHVGLNAHEAGASQRIPVPSLLRSLLTDHLDPGYAAAARARAEGRTRRLGWVWHLVAGLSVATVLAAAVYQAQSVAPANRESQQVLSGSVRAAEARTDALTASRDALSGQVEGERRSRLAGDERGRALLADLDRASFASAATAVIGPGLTVVIIDPGVSRDLTDVSKQRVAGSRQVILDRDLQLVVNSLWVSGAEAIAVGGVRIGPNVTIRQAGGGILVDNQPISSPYTVTAIGPPHAMQEAFGHSAGRQRLALLEQSYGVGVTVSTGDALTVPASSVRDLRFAKQIGS